MTEGKPDPIWQHFIKYGDRKCMRAKCKKCNKDMAALVSRMKEHVKKCRNVITETNPQMMQDSTSSDDGKLLLINYYTYNAFGLVIN